jgi:hypothetical protein
MKSRPLYSFVLSAVGTSLIMMGAQAATVYVAPNGNGNGLSPDSPTNLVQAQDIARKQARSGSVNVILKGGRYELADTLRFDSRDSNVSYQSAPNEKAILSGGTFINGWSRVNGNLYSATLPSNVNLQFRQLYAELNGATTTRPVRAKSEQMGQIESWDIDGSGTFNVSGADWGTGTKTFNSNYPEMVVHRFWVQSYVRIRSIKAQGNGRYTVYPVTLDAKREQAKDIPNKEYGQPFYFTNDLSLLNRDNEWYLNSNTRSLYYMFPNGNTNDYKLIAPRLEHLVEIDGSKNLSFQNLTFADTTWLEPNVSGLTGIQGSFFGKSVDKNDWFPITAGVVVKNTKGVKFVGNIFKNMGSSGLELTSGTHSTLIEGNRFTQIAASGVQVYTTVGALTTDPASGRPMNTNMNPAPANRSSRDSIQNNYVDNTGLDYIGTVGIFATYPEYLTISHNEVYNMPYTGISVGWGWTNMESALKNNTIIGNHVHHVMQFLDDGGGIYLLSRQPGTRIEQNFVHDLNASATSGNRPVVPIYLDNMVEGTTVTMNVCQGFSGNGQVSNGVFYRPETGQTNSIQACLSNNASVINSAGPARKFSAMREAL